MNIFISYTMWIENMKLNYINIIILHKISIKVNEKK